MDIIITDVTDMSGGYVCVAGWSPEDGRMIRPLHATGHHHWEKEMAHDDLFCPGNIITLEPSGHSPLRGVPHATEDTLITGVPTLSSRLNHEEIVDAVAGSVYESVVDLFGDTFSEKKFVPDQTGIQSLGGLELSNSPVRFYDRWDKPTCWFVDHDEKTYSFPISCRALKELYAQHGVNGLDQLKAGSSKIHIRLGLANPWDGGSDNNWNPRRAYAMVNGMFFV